MEMGAAATLRAFTPEAVSFIAGSCSVIQQVSVVTTRGWMAQLIDAALPHGGQLHGLSSGVATFVADLGIISPYKPLKRNKESR
jgi:hypothetical protein